MCKYGLSQIGLSNFRVVSAPSGLAVGLESETRGKKEKGSDFMNENVCLQKERLLQHNFSSTYTSPGIPDHGVDTGTAENSLSEAASHSNPSTKRTNSWTASSSGVNRTGIPAH